MAFEFRKYREIFLRCNLNIKRVRIGRIAFQGVLAYDRACHLLCIRVDEDRLFQWLPFLRNYSVQTARLGIGGEEFLSPFPPQCNPLGFG